MHKAEVEGSMPADELWRATGSGKCQVSLSVCFSKYLTYVDAKDHAPEALIFKCYKTSWL
jgi:hypothetical protein